MKLTLTRTGFDVGLGARTGWHLIPITRAQIGTVGKIEEELLEYEDACTQNLFLLRAFELSDMVGAVAAFLWARQIPFDLAQPSERAKTRAHLLQLLDFPMAIRQVLPHLEVAQDHERLQVLAETLLILLFRESELIGLKISDLLAQAQLRSAIAINKAP